MPQACLGTLADPALGTLADPALGTLADPALDLTVFIFSPFSALLA